MTYKDILYKTIVKCPNCLKIIYEGNGLLNYELQKEYLNNCVCKIYKEKEKYPEIKPEDKSL